MVEIWAAILASGISIIGAGSFAIARASRESREAIIHLTDSVKHGDSTMLAIHQELRAFRQEVKVNQKDTYDELNDHDKRLAILECKLLGQNCPTDGPRP